MLIHRRAPMRAADGHPCASYDSQGPHARWGRLRSYTGGAPTRTADGHPCAGYHLQGPHAHWRWLRSYTGAPQCALQTGTHVPAMTCRGPMAHWRRLPSATGGPHAHCRWAHMPAITCRAHSALAAAALSHRRAPMRAADAHPCAGYDSQGPHGALLVGSLNAARRPS
jgi:hypothetical protein